jgi:hypothetical protein
MIPHGAGGPLSVKQKRKQMMEFEYGDGVVALPLARQQREQNLKKNKREKNKLLNN